MSDHPLVSIIIPTYNRAHLIGETLDSVVAQTYENWECIIVDDGSSDNTDEVIGEYVKKDSRFKYYHRPEEHLPGGNGARNYGFKMSQGEYIQWFDSDDLMFNDKLNISLASIEKSLLDIAISNFTSSNGIVNDLDENIQDLLQYHITEGTINTPMFFCRRTFIKDFIFNEELKRAQEFEFFIRVLMFAKKFVVINKVTVKVRVHSDSISASYLKPNEDMHSSTLFAKFMALKVSKRYNHRTIEISKRKFLRALWKSILFKHKSIFFTYFFKYFVFQRKKKYKEIFFVLILSLLYLITSKGYTVLKGSIFKL